MTRGAESARPRVELLWFRDCPDHPVARTLLEEIRTALAPGTTVNDIDATDPIVARRHRFPGSPTIRIDGRDVDPSFKDPGDYTPRCGHGRPTGFDVSLSGPGSRPHCGRACRRDDNNPPRDRGPGMGGL